MSGHDVVNIGESVAGPAAASSGGAAGDPCQRILDAIGLRRRAGDEAKLCGWLRPRLRELGLPSVDAYADLLVAGGGTYGQWSFRVLDEARTARYFRKCGREWRIDARLRAMVDFERHDLLLDETGGGGADAGGFDLILCRNVFIYLMPPAVTHIAEKLAATLSDGGYFVPGHGELLGCTPPGLETLAWPDAMLYRRPASGAPVPPAPAVPVCAPSSPSSPSSPSIPPRGPAAAPPAGGESPRQRGSGSMPDAVPEAGPDESLARAWCDADRGAAQAARAACERVIAVSPLDPRPYFLLAQLAEERGAIDEARTLLRKVLYLDPGFVVAHLELADLCARTGDARRARQMRAQALRELERMPLETPLPVPPHVMAGTLLQSLRAGDAATRGAAEGGSHG